MAKYNFKVGDKVTVYRASNKGYWIKPSMNKLVGESGVVLKNFDKDSVVVQFFGAIKDRYYIPVSSLKYSK